MFWVRKTVAASLVLSLGFLFAAMVVPAHGATVLGSNFDGNMSVIYDSSSGNLFLENAPLPNPAVQQISIASLGGNLLPGNLNFPLLAPPVTVTSSTTSLIDISWSSGNFLGTGSFLGNILGPSILQSTLLSDLTIDWTPASSSQVSGDLLYGTLGTTAGNPGVQHPARQLRHDRDLGRRSRTLDAVVVGARHDRIGSQASPEGTIASRRVSVTCVVDIYYLPIWQ